MFRNTMPRYEVLSEEAMATLDRGWRRLMTEIGVEFMDERALELFRKAGQRVEDNTVFLDPDFVLDTDTLVTGDDCFVLTVRARSMRHLEEITGRIAGLGGVTTSVVYSSPLPRRSILAATGTSAPRRRRVTSPAARA